jgi:hypothetical protein
MKKMIYIFYLNLLIIAAVKKYSFSQPGQNRKDKQLCGSNATDQQPQHAEKQIGAA